jgi:tripartite-type tricarboxylate transporter receptor subunit TctC
MRNLFLAILLLTAWGKVHADTVVSVIWPFALDSPMAAMTRSIIDEANNQQKKYRFIFEHKPGAGGSVAANHLKTMQRPAIMFTSTSFITRPYLYVEGRYDIRDFQIINVFCLEQPLVLVSNKFAKTTDLGSSQFTIGSNFGSITELVARQYQKQGGLDLIHVAFKGTPEIVNSVMGKHIDMGVGFVGDVRNYNINVLGITGSKSHGGYNTFASQGIKGLENMVVDYFMIIKNTMDDAVKQEIGEIMKRAASSSGTQKFCSQDFGIPANIAGKDAQKYFDEVHGFWKKNIESNKDTFGK